MATLWRISNYADLEGVGGEKFASRWASMGRRIVYLAESPASALLEVLVHLELEPDEIPTHFQLLEIQSADDIQVRDLMPLADANWREQIGNTRKIGDQWLTSLETPLARVPSAIVPRTWNLLLNPIHPDAKNAHVVSAVRERFDVRLFRFGPR